MLNHYGFGGILADDMGLGKTQTIFLFGAVLQKETKILILAPSAYHLQLETKFSKFAPPDGSGSRLRPQATSH